MSNVLISVQVIKLPVFGKSGTGKSTFLNLLAGTLKPDSGSVMIGETDLTGLSESGRDRMRSQNLGYVFQSFHLLQGCTALENVLVAMAVAGIANEDRAKELLSLVGISEKKVHFHLNYRLDSSNGSVLPEHWQINRN